MCPFGCLVDVCVSQSCQQIGQTEQLLSDTRPDHAESPKSKPVNSWQKRKPLRTSLICLSVTTFDGEASSLRGEALAPPGRLPARPLGAASWSDLLVLLVARVVMATQICKTRTLNCGHQIARVGPRARRLCPPPHTHTFRRRRNMF